MFMMIFRATSYSFSLGYFRPQMPFWKTSLGLTTAENSRQSGSETGASVFSPTERAVTMKTGKTQRRSVMM
jgi:hypothetical protein